MIYSNFYDRFYNWSQKAGSALKAFWRFRSSRFYLLIFTLLQLLAWWQASSIFRHLSGNILVLHYNVDLGIDLVGSPIQIFLYPLYGLGILVLNSIIAASTHHHKDFNIFTHLLLAAAVLFALFLNLVLLFIYLINFR